MSSLSKPTVGSCLKLHLGTANAFAVAWNGLIYPVTSVGAIADIKADVNGSLERV